MRSCKRIIVLEAGINNTATQACTELQYRISYRLYIFTKFSVVPAIHDSKSTSKISK